MDKLKTFAWFNITSIYSSVGALTAMGWLYIISIDVQIKWQFYLHFNHIYGHEFG